MLENTSKIRAVIDDGLKIFVDCMDSLYELKLACFGYSHKEDYKEKIKIQPLKTVTNLLLEENMGCFPFSLSITDSLLLPKQTRLSSLT